MTTLKKVNLKNRQHYFFNDMINIRNLDPNLLNMYISFKNADAAIYNTKKCTHY